MATVDDLPVPVQASAQAFANLWAYVKDGEDEDLKALVADAHHTTSDALDLACEVFDVSRDTLLPPPPVEHGAHTESAGGDKPPRGG